MAGNCKVYTPDSWVNILLDEAGYRAHLYGKRILENSCGTGNILRRIVERYIVDSLNAGFSTDEIARGLERDITGLEIDSNSLATCKHRLDTTAEALGIYGIKWDLRLCDALTFNEHDYSYVIGNPPYVTYHDLSVPERKFLRERFDTCKKGRFDYCYAFIEKSINNLSDCGVLAYILPNSVLKNVWAKAIRTYLHPYLRKIIDLKNKKVFEDVTLSPIILVAQKSSRTSTTQIHFQCDDDKVSLDIETQLIEANAWALGTYVSSSQHRFGDYFQVANSVATLLNDAFIIENYSVVDSTCVRAKEQLIEQKILRPAISIKSLHAALQPLIIFPYSYDQNGNLLRYDDATLQKQFPSAYEYLCKYRKALEMRTSDSSAKWFEYGRSQALRHLNKSKLVISTIVSGKVKIAIADENAIPYAGLYIVSKSTLPLIRAKEILEQQDFLSYVKQHGVPTTHNSYRISKKIIEEYPFTM